MESKLIEERRQRAAAMLRTTLAKEWAAAMASRAPERHRISTCMPLRVCVSAVIDGDEGKLNEPLYTDIVSSPFAMVGTDVVPSLN